MIHTEAELEERLSRPSAADIAAVRDLTGPILLLGAAGKMGPSLAHRLRRALDAAGNRAELLAVSRFSSAPAQQQFEEWGIPAIACDMLEPHALDGLPDAQNIVFLAARKFGSSGNPALTWATNALLPGLVAQRYRGSRIVAFSSGNVYPLVAVDSGGATEETPVGPLGEYAQSVLARERLFEHAALAWGAQVTLLRLNYAVELRYGVLVDIGRKVFAGEPVDVAMGHVNVIWQGDANSVALRCLGRSGPPLCVLNLTGRETLLVREIAEAFAVRFRKSVELVGREAGTALLNNSTLCRSLFGEPEVSVEEMIDWIAAWIQSGGNSLQKPTHFENREGRF